MSAAKPADAPKGEKKSGKGKLFLLLGLALVLVGAGRRAGSSGGRPSRPRLRRPPRERSGHAAPAEHAAAEAAPSGALPFKPFIVNLADPSGSRF